MKKTSKGKAEARVLRMADKLGKRIGNLAARAQGQVEGKGEWVAGKLRQAAVKIERSIGK